MKPYLDITDPSLARALAHPLRARILATLEDRTASPSEIADELDAPLGVVSYHVRRLAALKLLKLVKREPRRGAIEHYYTATTRPRIADRAWESMPSVIRDAALGSTLAELGREVIGAAASGGFDRPEAHLTRRSLVLDDEGWKELSLEIDEVLARMQRIEAASRARLALHKRRRQPAAVVLILFDPAKPEVPAGASDAGGG